MRFRVAVLWGKTTDHLTQAIACYRSLKLRGRVGLIYQFHEKENNFYIAEVEIHIYTLGTVLSNGYNIAYKKFACLQGHTS